MSAYASGAQIYITEGYYSTPDIAEQSAHEKFAQYNLIKPRMGKNGTNNIRKRKKSYLLYCMYKYLLFFDGKTIDRSTELDHVLG